jgi:hypothetical protein
MARKLVARIISNPHKKIGTMLTGMDDSEIDGKGG